MVDYGTGHGNERASAIGMVIAGMCSFATGQFKQAQSGLEEALAQGVEQGGVRLGVREGHAGRVQGGDAAEGEHEAHRARAGVEPVGEEPRGGAALVGRGAHQRHLGVVLVEGAPAELHPAKCVGR